MKKPLLLIFIEHYLPGYKFGGPVQSVANLVALLRDHYTISIVTRDRDFGELTPYDNVKTNQWLEQDGYRVRYLSPAKSKTWHIRALLTEAQYDFIYTNSLFADFTRHLLLLTLFNGRKIVIAPRGELHPGALQLKAYKKKPFVWLVQQLFTRKIIWHATDHEELQAVRQHFVHYRVRYAAPVRFAPDTPKRLISRETYLKQSGTVSLVFISRLTQKKGICFLLDILTRYRTGTVILDIFGPVVDEAAWMKCVKLIEQTPANCRITYRGPIRHDKVNETLIRYDFFVLPTLGENFGHAIFEALSAGVPVMISDQTPWRNLTTQQAGWDLPLTEEAWIDALNHSVQMSDSTYATWSKRAVEVTDAYVEDNKFEQSYLSLFS